MNDVGMVRLSLDRQTLRKLIASRVLTVEELRCQDSRSRDLVREVVLQVAANRG